MTLLEMLDSERERKLSLSDGFKLGLRWGKGSFPDHSLHAGGLMFYEALLRSLFPLTVQDGAEHMVTPFLLNR